jgi:hypothetical protein
VTPDAIAAVATGSQQLTQVIGQIPRSVPLQDTVWGFTSIYTFMRVSLILLAFRVEWLRAEGKGAAEAKTELLQQQVTQKQAPLNWLTKGYVDLKRDNSKTA